jgi:Tol biopolymer transport system component
VLVSIDEHGDRRRELFPLPRAAAMTRDTNPAISPDGRWVVFASSRGRSLDETSLWIAPLDPAAGAAPVAVGAGAWIDAHPAWTPDGTALVFASTRDGAGFDLERGELALGPAPHFTRVDRLTDSRDHEVTPAVARDGTIVFAAVADLGDGRVESKLEVRAPDGAIRVLTAGPADTTPAIAPDGCTVAFARPIVRGGRNADGELWTVPLGAPGCPASASEPARLVDLPLTDETGPVWSADGRYLFATSMLRGADGTPVFSSVIYVDVTARPVVARLLEDHAGAIARLTPALAPGGFDTAALAANPEYLPELARILAGPIEEARQRIEAAP